MPTATHSASSPHPFLSSFFASPPLLNDDLRITTSKSPHDGQLSSSSSTTFLADDRSRDHVVSSPLDISPKPISTPFAHQGAVSASPAAMFLSAFCSPVIPQRSPDDEGEAVAGYTLADIIGRGAFSTIRRAYSTSGGIVAVKIVRRSDLAKQEHTTRKRLENEETVWSSLSHEHILPLFTSVHTSYADFYVTLYCPAGSLFDILKRDGSPALPQDDAGMMFRQVVRGLRYLHEVALFVHRDLKLENVLVDEMGICRIGDFGMTRKIGESEEETDDEAQEFFHQHAVHRAVSLAVPSSKYLARTGLVPRNHPAGGLRHRNSTSSTKPQFPTHNCQPGSLPYASPELLSRQTASQLLPHPAQDIWALGVLLYALLTGRLPFSDSFEPRLQMKILNGVFELPTDIGRGAERVLKGCMERSVEKRWTITMVDEVAWGIGWGSEGDQVTPPEIDEEFDFPPQPTRRSSAAPSRSQSRHHNEFDDVFPEKPEWQNEEARSRSAREAASRRSSSRAERSMSRAPILPSRRASRVRAPSSRAASPPSRKPLTVDPSASNSNSTSSSSSASSPFEDAHFLVSPVFPSPIHVERGRRAKPQYYSHSRSPSPSIPPSTPIDVSTSVRFTSPVGGIGLDEHEHEPHHRHLPRREPSRGRRRVYDHSQRRSAVGQLLESTTDALEELDVLDESRDWMRGRGEEVKSREARDEDEHANILSPLQDLRRVDEATEEEWHHHHEHVQDHEHEHETIGPLPNTRRTFSPVRRTKHGHARRHRRPESTPPAPMSSSSSSFYTPSRYPGKQSRGFRHQQPSPPPPPTPCLLSSEDRIPPWLVKNTTFSTPVLMPGQLGRGRSDRRSAVVTPTPTSHPNSNSIPSGWVYGGDGRVGGRSGIVRSRSLGYEPRRERQREDVYVLRGV